MFCSTKVYEQLASKSLVPDASRRQSCDTVAHCALCDQHESSGAGLDLAGEGHDRHGFQWSTDASTDAHLDMRAGMAPGESRARQPGGASASSSVVPSHRQRAPVPMSQFSKDLEDSIIASPRDDEKDRFAHT